MQPNRRFVEDIEHADQTAADLPGEADTLRLTAGERGGRAAERQIVEPHIGQKSQSTANFLEHFAGDFLLRFVEREAAEKLLGLVDRQITDGRQSSLRILGEKCVRRCERHRPRLWIEPCPCAVRAQDHVHDILQA